MNYTQNYQLPQWESSDRILMDDFNDAMEKLEDGLSEKIGITFGTYTGNGKTMAEAVSHAALIKDRRYGIQEEFSPWVPKFDFVNVETLAALPEEAIKSSGYVVDTLQAALWCLLTTDSYMQCVLKAVNLGSDTDTVAAVAGGLAGILYGVESIPEDWLNVLAKKEEIVRLCENFLSA